MNRTFAITFVVGIAVVAIAITGVLFMQRGARIGITGGILKARTGALDENSSIAVIDFRFANPSNVVFVVRTVQVIMEDQAGVKYEGRVISEMDAQRLFEGMPLLGQKFNQTLRTREEIAPHTTEDRMVAARFEAPEVKLQERKRFLVRVEEIDGQISELSEK